MITIKGTSSNCSRRDSMHAKTYALPRNGTTRFFVFTISSFAFALLLLQNQIAERSDPTPLAPHSSRWLFLHDQLNGDTGTDCARKLASMTQRLRDTINFLPLKNLRFASSSTTGHTWFMSSLNDSFAPDVAEHLHFPSNATGGRLLCLAGGSRSNGTHNSYALAWRDALPVGAVLLEGLTFVSETYYDYGNIWHGLSASVPFVGWHKWRGCAKPARWVLFHWGEVRPRMSVWVRTLMEATFGQEVVVDMIDRGDRPTCFEEAVVFRHNEGSIPKLKRRELYDMMRCKARRYCNISTVRDPGEDGVMRMTMFLRTGTRSFRNESATIEVFRRECAKVSGCRSAVVRPDNLTFCDQVRVMSNTDVLISQHGAQLTNLIFVDQNTSIMEFFPKGWKELAGVGRHVYRWIASWSGMRYQGAYKESFEGGGGGGRQCPFPPMDIRCFTYYKDWQIGLNESYFANWTSRVLKEVKEYKLEKASRRKTQLDVTSPSECGCDGN